MEMRPADRGMFMLHADTPEYRTRLAASLRELDRLPDGGTVLYSGGKDSAVVLHMSVEAGKCSQAVHYDAGAELMPRRYYDEIVGQGHEICGDRAELVIINDSDLEIPKGISYVIGSLRADENGRRRAAGPDAPAFGVRCRHVIFEWSWLDVWAYIVSNNVPYNSSYLARAPIEGWPRARFSMFFADDLAHLTGAVDALTAWRDRGW